MKKVTGIGGIFFKCKNADLVREWYKFHLGMDVNQYGANFEWRELDQPDVKGSTQWSPFDDTITYFEPSKKDFMINYRVENIEDLVATLKSEGVNVLDDIAVYEYGKFVHIMDVEGNKIQLWEPVNE